MASLDLLPAITDRIVSLYQPLRIVLFGSQARGDTHPWSDIDLLVVLPQVQNNWDTKLEIQSEIRDLGSVDITVTCPEEIGRRGDMVGTLLRPALREGRVIYERAGAARIPKAGRVSEDELRREVSEWIAYAQDDQALAEQVLGQAQSPPRHAGFNAQQAAEKALKAVYIYLQIQYPFVHDLDQLRTGLPDDWRFKDEFSNLKGLSMWSVEARHPGVQEENSHEDAARHVAQARALLTAIRRDLREHGFPEDL